MKELTNPEKSKLRKIFGEKRSSLSKDDVRKKSQQICQNFINNLLPKIYQKNSDKIFSLYLPINNEVDTKPIIKHFFKHKIKFSYPKIQAKDQPLKFILAEKIQQFAINNFYPKILEPTSKQEVYPDFIIMPLLAFDRNLSRLGMGGGFFDRTISFLKLQKTELLTIALAYDFQQLKKTIPTEITDQMLDFVVTQKTIFSSNQQPVNVATDNFLRSS